jgi:hypothetical protein
MTSDLDNTRDQPDHTRDQPDHTRNQPDHTRDRPDHTETGDVSLGDRARNRAYRREFWPGMVGYVVVLLAVSLLGHLDGTSNWRFVLALLPMAPLVLVVRAVMKHLHRVDDYQRQLTYRGLSVGFLVAMTASLTIGFLGFAGLQVPGAGWVVWSLGMTGWAAAPLGTRAWAK